jgi:hypothetical protein
MSNFFYPNIFFYLPLQLNFLTIKTNNMKKIILALALLGMLQTTVAQKKKKVVKKETTITASEPVVRTSSSSSSSSSSSITSSSRGSSSGQEGFRAGDIFISGSFGYVSKKNDAGSTTSETSILPSLGYFLKYNIALLGTIGFKNTDNGGSSANTFVIGAAARYYTTPAAKFSLFGQAGIGFESAKNSTAFTIGVKPGLSYFLNNHFSVEATVGEFGIVNTSVDGGGSNTDFNFGADLTQLGIGLNYKF